jgi:hypothetical protein
MIETGFLLTNKRRLDIILEGKRMNINHQVFWIAIPTICYTIVSILQLRSKDFPMALVYGAYALANVGLIWYELSKE